MEKMQKAANKPKKSKKNQPLKVVYITNPVKFNTTASGFRALVQELTGQDAHPPESPAHAAGDNVHAVGEEEKVEQEGPDPLGTGLYDVDEFFGPEIIEISRGLWD